MIEIKKEFTNGYLESWNTTHTIYINVGNEDDNLKENRCIGLDKEDARALAEELINFANSK